MIFFAELAILLLDKFLLDNNFKDRILCLIGIVISAGGFILVFYPAWQIPTAWAFVFIAMWVLIKDFKQIKLSKKDIIAISVALIAFIVCMTYIIVRSYDTLKTILNTINVLSKNNKLGKINYVLLKNINLNEFRGVLEYICKHNYTLDVLNYLGDDTIKVKKFHLEFDDIYKIIAKYYNVVREENFINNYSITSKRLYLKNGGVINLKVNKLSDYFFLKSCSTCLKRNICKEGIAAIRLTTEGKIQPCLFRYDNILDMKKVIDNNELSDSKAIVYNYFENL